MKQIVSCGEGCVGWAAKNMSPTFSCMGVAAFASFVVVVTVTRSAGKDFIGGPKAVGCADVVMALRSIAVSNSAF